MKLLDCTLRDGGYYNNWNFSRELVEAYLDAVSKSGVEIVELGYKSASLKDGFYGLYRFCPESQLQFVKKYKNLEYAFMLDTKEFCDEKASLDYELLDKVVKPADESVFSWVRIASYQKHVEQSCELSRYMASKGYRITFNFMGVSLLERPVVEKSLETLSNEKFDIVYFADSFGNFFHEDLLDYFNLFNKFFEGKIGFHAHDNMGLAFANAFAALEKGVEFIDSTILGMGRGAGNLKTEQILPALYFKKNMQQMDAFPLMEVIERYFNPLMAEYHWGWDYSYMISGLENIHPTYCQKLRSGKQYNMAQVANILNEISSDMKGSYNEAEMIKASSRVLHVHSGNIEKEISGFESPRSRDILLVAKGKSVAEHLDGLKSFIDIKKPLVLECNNTGYLNGISRYMAVLNTVKYHEVFSDINDESLLTVITGFDSIEEPFFHDKARHFPFELKAGMFDFAGDKAVIPSFLVGMYAGALALKMGAENIYLAGFDGFANNDVRGENSDMAEFWHLLGSNERFSNLSVKSLVPTLYDNLNVSSVYAYLD